MKSFSNYITESFNSKPYKYKLKEEHFPEVGGREYNLKYKDVDWREVIWNNSTDYGPATLFYEFGWGQSFHFAIKKKGESFYESLHRHERFLAGEFAVDGASRE